MREVIRNAVAELDPTLGLAGHTAVADLDGDTLTAA
jgi:hypothetical protein